jgi:hypothetical protein
MCLVVNYPLRDDVVVARISLDDLPRRHKPSGGLFALRKSVAER